MSNVVDLPVEPGPAGSQGTMIEQMRAVAEVAAAVRVARDFPREPNKVRAAVDDLCGRLAVAQRAFYEVPNRGSGMSVHIARELVRIYGNADYGVRELRRDDLAGESEMQAWAWDQESNVRSSRSFIVPHARMSGKGAAKRREALTDLSDIYLNNQNIAARAVRECIFTILPGALLAEAEAKLLATLKNGDGKPIEVRVADAIALFADIGVKQLDLETRVDLPSSEWQPAHLATLARIYTTVTQDGIPITEFFPESVVDVAELGAPADV